MEIGIVGAGFSGSVVARVLAERGHRCNVFESRDHVAGNCHTTIDTESSVVRHEYGPHIFHTSDSEVWGFVNRFCKFEPFENRVKAIAQGQFYSMPINLHTLSQFYGHPLTPEQARKRVSDDVVNFAGYPRNFEEQALSLMGPNLYQAFFYGYTKKQWGVEPSELPASILRRLPFRFTFNDNYFNDTFQGIPEKGYTPMIVNMLDHENISVTLNAEIRRGDLKGMDHLFVSAPLDCWYEYRLGQLRYRSLQFEEFRFKGDFQGCPVVNYCDMDVPWTRITDHSRFSKQSETKSSLCFRETSSDFTPGTNDIRFYPMRLADDKLVLDRYLQLTASEPATTFLGRLGTYRYLDMHVAIREALDASYKYLNQI